MEKIINQRIHRISQNLSGSESGIALDMRRDIGIEIVNEKAFGFLIKVNVGVFLIQLWVPHQDIASMAL